METHGRRQERDEADGEALRPRPRDRAPLDLAWLERQALDYLARTEAPRRALGLALERRLRARGARTGESVDALVDAVPALIDTLVARGYVDDARYARQRYDRGRREGRSRARIRASLERKGVEPDTLDAVEAERATGNDRSEELAAAIRTARRRRLGPFHPDPLERETLRTRHLGVLARGGFSEEIATRVLDASPEVLEESEGAGAQ
jgi:regulatory protein